MGLSVEWRRLRWSRLLLISLILNWFMNRAWVVKTVLGVFLTHSLRLMHSHRLIDEVGSKVLISFSTCQLLRPCFCASTCMVDRSEWRSIAYFGLKIASSLTCFEENKGCSSPSTHCLFCCLSSFLWQRVTTVIGGLTPCRPHRALEQNGYGWERQPRVRIDCFMGHSECVVHLFVHFFSSFSHFSWWNVTMYENPFFKKKGLNLQISRANKACPV